MGARHRRGETEAAASDPQNGTRLAPRPRGWRRCAVRCLVRFHPQRPMATRRSSCGGAAMSSLPGTHYSGTHFNTGRKGTRNTLCHGNFLDWLAGAGDQVGRVSAELGEDDDGATVPNGLVSKRMRECGGTENGEMANMLCESTCPLRGGSVLLPPSAHAAHYLAPSQAVSPPPLWSLY